MRARVKAVLRRSGLLESAATVATGLRGAWGSGAAARRRRRDARRLRDGLDTEGTDFAITETVIASLRTHTEVRIVARRRPAPSAIGIMESNHDLVAGILTAADIPFVDLPIALPDHLRVGIRHRDRRAALEALTARATPATYLWAEGPTIPTPERLLRLATSDADRCEALITRAVVWGVFEYHCAPDGSDAVGPAHLCEIEVWEKRGSDHVAVRPNLLVSSVSDRDFATAAQEPAFRRATRPPLATLADFPVDVVYTWVDGADPAWQRRKAETLGSTGAEHHAEAANAARYASHDELRFSLRSLEKYADFVRHVFVVTDDQRPAWLRRDHPRLTVVDHREVFDDHTALPTFNSHAIEARLHHVPGLAEHYLYMNDDFLFGGRVTAESFFLSSGLSQFFPSPALVPFGERTAETKPVDWAAMNGRRLVTERFGRASVAKMKHAPYAQLRSVNLAIEEFFPDEVRRTVHSRVRHPDDLAIASSLHHHVGFALGRSVPGGIPSAYVDLGDAALASRLDALLAVRDFRVLCLNDSDSAAMSPEEKDRLTRRFLEAMFPEPSSFEVPGT